MIAAHQPPLFLPEGEQRIAQGVSPGNRAVLTEKSSARRSRAQTSPHQCAVIPSEGRRGGRSRRTCISGSSPPTRASHVIAAHQPPLFLPEGEQRIAQGVSPGNRAVLTENSSARQSRAQTPPHHACSHPERRSPRRPQPRACPERRSRSDRSRMGICGCFSPCIRAWLQPCRNRPPIFQEIKCAAKPRPNPASPRLQSS